MISTTQPSDSSEVLEARLEEPLADVSLVIVHVHNGQYRRTGAGTLYYDAYEPMVGPVKGLIEERVASNVFEHCAYNQSVLDNLLKLGWKPGKRHADFEKDQVNYHLIDNETNPGDYSIPVVGRRIIFAGGSIANCLKRAGKEQGAELFLNHTGERPKEMHFAVGLLYDFDYVDEEGDFEIRVSQSMGPLYAVHQLYPFLGGKSYFISVDGVIPKEMVFVSDSRDRSILPFQVSFEEPTMHLALWSSPNLMLDYLRNNQRLTIGDVS